MSGIRIDKFPSVNENILELTLGLGHESLSNSVQNLII
jgi:hypothetical protein